MLQVLKLIIFSLYGSGDVQPWDTIDKPRKLFHLPGEESETDDDGDGGDDDDYIDRIADDDTTDDYNGYDSDVERLI